MGEAGRESRKRPKEAKSIVPKILLVDDDRELVDLLGFALRRAGLDVVPAYDAVGAMAAMDGHRPDLAVLDVNLGPSSNGFDLLAQIRRISTIPVIFLTGRSAEADILMGLDSGGDDYLTKPFSHHEVIARIRAHLRRAGRSWTPVPMEQPQMTVGPITVDIRENRAEKNGEALHLTVTEFRLLHYLMLNAGSVVPTEAILKHVWGYEDRRAGDILRVTLFRLRRKLETDPHAPQLLQTIPGVGVLLKAPPQ